MVIALFRASATGFAVLALLCGCGGGSDDEPTAPIEEPDSYALGLQITGSGRVTSSPAGLDCTDDCSASFANGASVSLSATPAQGFNFTGWSGACNGTSSCVVQMTDSRSVSATFQSSSSPPPPPPPPPGNAALTVQLVGSGTVSSNPAGINCGTDCAQNYASGTSVTLTASAGTNYTFTGWSGACSGTAAQCTVQMTANRQVTASFQTTVVSANLCEGLVTDKTNRPLSATAVQRPAVGQTFVDPQFGTTIRRITNHDLIGKSYVKTMYSTQPAWSKDEKWMLLLSSGYEHVLYDGTTYAFIRNISDDINPSDGEQVMWSQAEPDVLFYANASQRTFHKYNVVTQTGALLHDFKTAPSSCTTSLSLGDDPMYGSWDGTKIGLICGTKTFTYDFTVDRVYAVKTESTGGNAPIVSPSGTKQFLAANPAQVRDLDGTLIRTIPNLTAHEHASLGKYANGHDAFFTVQFDDNPGVIVGADLDTGAITVHVGEDTGWPYPPSGTHVSALAIDNPGWVAASMTGDEPLGQSVFENEIVLANVDTGSVCRIGHHRSAAVDYFSEPHVVPSPSGTRIAFSSDWFGTDGADVYVIELPAYRP